MIYNLTKNDLKFSHEILKIMIYKYLLSFFFLKLNIQYCHDLFVLLKWLFFLSWTNEKINKDIQREKERCTVYVLDKWIYVHTHIYTYVERIRKNIILIYTKYILFVIFLFLNKKNIYLFIYKYIFNYYLKVYFN